MTITAVQKLRNMDIILGLVFDGTIMPAELVQWLLNSQLDSTTVELEPYTSQRREFVPFFLNFLRDHCPTLQQPQKSPLPARPHPKIGSNVRRVELQSPPGSSTPTRSRNREDVFCELPYNRDSAPSWHRHGGSGNGLRRDSSRQEFPSVPPRNDDHRINLLAALERNDRSRSHQQTTTVVPDIQDDQNFPVVGVIVGKPKPIRRITPTPVKQHWRKLTVSDFLPPEVSRERVPCQDKASRGRTIVGDDTGPPKKGNKGSPDGQQRSPPVAAPVSCQRQTVDDKQRQHDRDKVPLNEYVVPVCECVTERKKLDALLGVYAGLINAGLVGNLTIELFFVLQLLTLKVKKTAVPEGPLLLCSVHNCAYFAVGVLKEILAWLRFLDRPTLKLLSSVQHLATFSPQLQTDLALLAEEAPSVSRVWPSSVQGVAFEAATDNRRNFSCEHNFHLFRKQRDMFYDLFHEWQRHHFDSGTTFEARFPRRVAEILDVCNDPCNYSHLARLVLTQLVTSCSGGAEMDGGLGEDLLAELKSTLPDKFERLEERFVHPFKVGGPCPSPSFPGCQGFFHDFVKAASSASFHQHFKDQCVEKIVTSERDDVFVDVDMPPGDEEKRRFFSLVHRLKLLGLFLGLVEFLPYQSLGKFPVEQRESQRSIRNLRPLPIDVVGSLRRSVCRKRQLVATLAWTVNFMSMADPVGTTLDGYRLVLGQLSAIYGSDALRSVEPTSFLARALLGWLFEVLNVRPALFAFAGVAATIVLETEPESLVDQQIVYACCPYLGELRCLLAEHLAGSKSRYGGDVRKITPVSARDVEDETASAMKRLDRQLEENFFHMHPQSVRKIVEFVAERVSSNVAKLIKRDISVAIENVAADVTSPAKPGSNAQKETEKVTNARSPVFLKLKERLERESAESCREQVDRLIPLLLPQDTQEQVVRTCCQLSAKSAALKVQRWLTVNITESILKDAANVSATTKPAGAASCNNAAHHGASRAFDVLNDLRLALQRLCCDGGHVPTESAISLLERCEHSLNSRLEWTPSSIRVAQQTSFDFVVCLAIFSPTSFTHGVFLAALPLWTESGVVPGMCRNLMCTRNLQLVRMSGDAGRGWSKLGELLRMLVSQEFVSTEDLGDMLQAVGELRGCDDSAERAAGILRGIIDGDMAEEPL
ncbi:codanin-1 [Ixodes scapularis]